MGHGSPFFKSPFEFSHFPFSGWIHQFHEFPSLVPMEKSPWKSPIFSSDKAPKNCRSHTSWCTSGISCWSPWPSRKPREPMAEAEDPEVMGDELAIVVFNLYQLGPMGRYIYIGIYLISSDIMLWLIFISLISSYICSEPLTAARKSWWQWKAVHRNADLKKANCCFEPRSGASFFGLASWNGDLLEAVPPW